MLNLLEVDDVIYDCTQCSHQTASLFQLDHHDQRYHKNTYAIELFHAIVEPEQFSCICCDYKSHYRVEMYEGCKQAHNLRSKNDANGSSCEELGRYPCDYCRYGSNSSLSLVKHHVSCKKIALLRMPPPYRLTSGVTKADLNKMLLVDLNRAGVRTFDDTKLSTCDASKKVQFKCSQCSYRAKRKTHLKQHMLRHATTEEIDWFQCTHCSYRAKRKQELKRHMFRHATNAEINWVQCSLCSFRAKHKSSFNRHMVRHAASDGVNCLQCKLCSYRAKKYKSSLTIHMLQHATDEEIDWFKCNHCSYRAKEKTNLRKHIMLQHAANNDISWSECNHCSYRTKHKSHLKRHML